jgi:hypothetical protein
LTVPQGEGVVQFDRAAREGSGDPGGYQMASVLFLDAEGFDDGLVLLGGFLDPAADGGRALMNPALVLHYGIGGEAGGGSSIRAALAAHQ